MKIFFDTEFTGLHKGTTLLSLGMVAEDGRMFYAELMDFDESQCDKWIMDNVVKNLIAKGNDELAKKLGTINNATVIIGEKKDVKEELSKWLLGFGDVQLVSDVCHYDMVLFIDLFGTAFDLPENVNASCHDINQDIAEHYHISEKQAFDKSREQIVKELCGKEIEGCKHNSLYDAMVIKAIYEEIK